MGKDGKTERGRGRRGLGIALMVLGIAAAAAAAFWTWHNEREAMEAFEAAQEVAVELEGDIEEAAELARKGKFVPDFMLDPTRAMPAVEVDGRRYVGVIEIPDLDLTLPVIEEWSYPALKIAPCRYNGTAYQDGFAICAHNYARHFGQIESLDTGNEIFFTDADGNRFGYVVDMKEILQPSDTAKVVYSDWPLTLFTCTVGGRTRMTVRCSRLEGQTGFEAGQ